MAVSPPAPDPLARSWRRAALVAWAVATVELVAVVILAVLLLGRPFISRATASESARPSAGTSTLSQARPSPVAAGTRARAGREALGLRRIGLRRDQTSVLVLNGNGRPGAAAAQAEQARSRGYAIAGVGNAARSDYARSLVMYRPGFRGEAGRLARDLGLELVVPLDGLRPRDLRGAHAVVIVGR